MIKALLASACALALFASPAQAAWYPGFSASATGGGGGGTSSYVGPGDNLPSGVTTVRAYLLAAYSTQAATLLVNVINVCGDGGTGHASQTTCANVPVLSTGLLNLTAVAPSNSSGPCSGGDGTCTIAIFYDQQAQITAGAPGTSGPTATAGAVTSRFNFWQRCSNNNVLTTTITAPCFTGAGGDSMFDSSVTTIAQPYTLSGVFQRANTTSGYGLVASGSLGTNGTVKGYSAVNVYAANAGSEAGFNVYETSASAAPSGLANSFSVLFNDAGGGTSLISDNGASQSYSGFAPGSGSIASSFYIGQHGSGGQLNGFGFAAILTQGLDTQAHLSAVSKSGCTVFGLGC